MHISLVFSGGPRKTMPRISTKPAVHWAVPEVDRLGRCWSDVSTEKGGPGSGQRKEQMWDKITALYHDPNDPPPIPVNGRGHECPPRDKFSLQSKWGRTKPIISTYMKFEMLAIANPKSGEDFEGTEKRAMKAYRTAKSKTFPYLSTYRILKVQPKWKLDVAQAQQTRDVRNGISQQTPIRERLARMKDKEPTVKGTKKPLGVKKARATILAIASKVTEDEKRTNCLTAYLEHFTKRAKIGQTVMGESSKRTAAIVFNAQVQDETNDDAIVSKDLSTLDEEAKTYYIIRRQHVIAKLLAKDHRILKKRAAVAIAPVLTEETPPVDGPSDPDSVIPLSDSDGEDAIGDEGEESLDEVDEEMEGEEGSGEDGREEDDDDGGGGGYGGSQRDDEEEGGGRGGS